MGGGLLNNDGARSPDLPHTSFPAPTRAKLTDHLGSTSVTADAGGSVLSSIRYTAFGETHSASGSTSTDYRYTGQREEAELGLYYYVARWYDPALGRFIQTDTIVPNPGNPMDWDRYAYVRNNPVNYTDPSGHMVAADTRENGCSGQGPACIMDMYYAESGDSEGLHDSVEAYVIRNPEYDPAQDPELTATGQFTVAAAKTRVGMQNGSFWDYVAFGTMVGFGTYTTGFAPAEPILGQNSNLSNRQRDIWGDPDCPGCGYIQALSPQDILMPYGLPIGTARNNPRIRTIQTESEMRGIFDALIVDAAPLKVSSYNGQLYILPNGGTVGWRHSSSSGGPTIDLKVPNIPIDKIHLQ